MKKILITVATIIALLCVLVLAGCEHEHEWGEWKTAKEPTCTEEGVEERVCKCGEKETKEIAEATNKEKSKITISEQVIVDANNVKITAKEYVEDSIWGDGISLQIYFLKRLQPVKRQMKLCTYQAVN